MCKKLVGALSGRSPKCVTGRLPHVTGGTSSPECSGRPSNQECITSRSAFCAQLLWIRLCIYDCRMLNEMLLTCRRPSSHQCAKGKETRRILEDWTWMLDDACKIFSRNQVVPVAYLCPFTLPVSQSRVPLILKDPLNRCKTETGTT